ncbi:MAG: hypothetical protein GYA58_02830 [Anaerolineaceae bacterium]|nr:hypothetical protein [Anaerolineaceae bacterium]
MAIAQGENMSACGLHMQSDKDKPGEVQDWLSPSTFQNGEGNTGTLDDAGHNHKENADDSQECNGDIGVMDADNNTDGIWKREDDVIAHFEGAILDGDFPRGLKRFENSFSKNNARKNYYSIFIERRSFMPHLPEQEIDLFLDNLKMDKLDEIWDWPLFTVENYFYHVLQGFEFVGDLPISDQAYKQLVEYIRRNAQKDGMIDPKKVPPVLYLISMVFCARYSESDARAFWSPYARMTWGLESASASFQPRCRKHFINCRNDLHQALSLDFDYQKRGDVVRPVYQHAIIPSYLQVHFAEWLVNNFESVMQYSSEQLPMILQNEKSLDYVPQRLRDFIRDEKTNETAARLITRMSNAIRLFHETERTDAVESVISSSIEKSLWQAIYKTLNIDQSRLMKLRKITPRLEWCWDCEEEELFLNLSNIRSNRSEKPDCVTWVDKETEYLKGKGVLAKIYPWRMKSGDWEVDPIRVEAEGLLDGSILVLSEEFDLNKNKQGQTEHIIFERDVPQMEKPLMFFRVKSRKDKNNIALHKSQIDSEGKWIVAASESFQITDETGNKVTPHSLNLPSLLMKSGFIQAGLYNIQSPVTVQVGERIIVFKGLEDQLELNPSLEGKEKVSGLAPDVPPVYCSQEVAFQFSFDQQAHPLQRTWLTIRRSGELVQSILLSSLQSGNKLKVKENQFTIELDSYLEQPGAYSLNLLHNMKPLLDEPVQFAWLPEEVEILGPDLDTCYSPLNPLGITIKGIPVEQIMPIYDEKAKIFTEEGNIKIEWRNLRRSQCRFAINWEGSLISFCWKVNRVSAWIEGGSNKEQVFEGQEQNVVLQVRGQPKEEFSWIIRDLGKSRKTQLNAKGEFTEKYVETEIRDMLFESDQAQSTVLIAIRDYTWDLFKYCKLPGVESIKGNYQRPELKIELKQPRKLRGNYTIQVRHKNNPMNPKVLADKVETLENNLVFQVDLVPGEYRVEILLCETLIPSSSDFRVAAEPVRAREVGTEIEVLSDFGSPEHLLRVLTASKLELFGQSYEGLSVAPAMEQLKLIQTPEEWFTADSWDEGFKGLLPSWAVLNYPLRFITKTHRKMLHVFPERVAYGGRAGMGYIELKLEENKMRVSASWKMSKDPEYSLLWMGVSQTTDVKRFSELNQLDLWPAYQCVDCGTIVASRDGSYLKLPPSIIRSHLHEKDRNLKEQFTDTVYDGHIEVNIVQYKDRLLLHTYCAKEVVFKNYLQLLIEGKTRPINRSLEQPINLYTNHDYGLAVSELFEHIQHPAVPKLREYSSDLDQLDQYFDDEKFNIPAFNAMQRLMQYTRESPTPLNIPGDVLSLSMVLRLKANHPVAYRNLLSRLGISEKKLGDFVECVAQVCPKLLEWSVAWAELFYIHAVS